MEDSRRGEKKVYNLAKSCWKGKNKLESVKNVNGDVLVDPLDSNTIWTEYINKLLSVEELEKVEGREIEGKVGEYFEEGIWGSFE